MAAISLTIGTRTIARTFPNGDAPRLRAAWKKRLGLPAAATDDQVVDAIGLWAFSQIVVEPLNQDRDVAAKTAGDAVVPIVLT